MDYSKEKQQTLVSSLTNIAALVGDNNIGIANSIKGLGISNEQVKCEEEAKAVRSGLFKIAVMGTFTSGKSTVINALIGAKVLPESTLPSTAILTYIQYGTDENRADVYMADENLADGSFKAGECISMSIEDFNREYQYTLEDEVEFKQTGTVARFAKVKNAVTYCSKSLMEGGVTIIDSPGLEDKAIATELALNIAEQAQAIIYVIPERGLSDKDKEYIFPRFKNCPNNLFFLVNKIDRVKSKEERQKLLEKVKLDLEPVFKGKQINTSLRDKRIFGVSALRALDSRRGMKYDDEEEIDVEIDDVEQKKLFEKSWFEPFEQELESFLTTDEKCIAQYQKCFTQMASTYRIAKKQVEDYIHIYENEIHLDDQKKKECDAVIADIQRNIDIIRTTFDNCSLKIQNAVANLLSGCASNIDKSWEDDMQKLSQKIDIGTFNYMWTGIKQMNPFASKQKKEAEMKLFTGKFIDAVSDYFTERIESYICENNIVIEKVVNECQDELNVEIENMDHLFNDLSRAMTSSCDVNMNTSDKNWIQIMISAYLGDYSAMFKGEIEGKTPWVEYLKKTVFNTVWQAVLVSFIDGGLGVLLAIGIEYVQGRNNKNETVKKLLNKSKDSLVKVIREKTDEMKDNLNKKIAAEINKKKEERCAEASQKLTDEQNKMANIEHFYKNHTNNLDLEKKRFENILSAIYNEAASAYNVVFGKQLTLQDFKEF